MSDNWQDKSIILNVDIGRNVETNWGQQKINNDRLYVWFTLMNSEHAEKPRRKARTYCIIIPSRAGIVLKICRR